MGANDTGVIGKAVRRKEDLRFLTGAGQYTDDVTLPRQTHAYFVRSPHAHAKIRKIDTAKAKAAPGVVAVFTGADMTGVNGLPCGWLITGMDGKPMNEPPHPVLAQGKVRHVGDQVALVIAETAAQAKDAAELVDVDYEVLPAVVSCVDALKPGAPQIHAEAPGNKCYTWALGDKAATDAAFAKAAHVTKLDIVNNRLIPNADRAARGGCRLQPRRRPVHAVRVEPESARRAAADDGVRARHPRDEGARDRTRRRRRLRVEDLPVRRGNRDGVGVEAGQPADQVGRRPQRGVPHRRARARPRHARRTGAGQGRQVPRDARDDHGQHGRVPVDVRVVHPDDPVRDAAGGPVHDARHLLRSDRVVHQHGAGRRVPRRGPPGGDVRRRAARAPGRRRHEDRAGRDPPAQLHPHVSRTRRPSRSRTTPATTTRRSTRR